MSAKQELIQDVQLLAEALRQADADGETEQATKLAQAWKKAKSRLELMESNPAEYDPESEEYQERYGAASGMSGFDKFVTGFDKGISDLGLGLRQRMSEIASVAARGAPLSFGGLARQKDSLQEEAQERRALDAPLNRGAGLAGQIAGNVTALLPAGGVATSLPRAMAVGAAEGLIQPSTSGTETAFNVGVGGVAGAGGELLARGINRAVTPFVRGNSARVDEAVDLLRREGVNLDVAQRTGSSGAQRIRSALGDNPITASRQQEFTENQLRQYTRAVLRRIGVEADEATPEVLERATREIGKKIDDALESAPPVFDTELASAIQSIQRQIPGTLTEESAKPLLNNIQKIFRAVDRQTGVISPSQFREIRSALSKLKRSTPAAGELAAELEDALLSALQRSGGDRAGLAQALAQWRNFRIIEGAIDKGVDKFVSPARLSGSMSTIRNRAVALRNLGHPETVELARLAEAGRSILPETIGNSGTFARALAGNVILGGGAGLGAFATGQDVGDAALIGLGAAALPTLLQKGMLSQGVAGNYLSGMAPPVLNSLTASPLTQALLRQTAMSGGLLSN